MSTLKLVGRALYALAAFSIAVSAADPPYSAEQRAVEYLSEEVPKWRRENNCFSCHNNGDAARALYVARALSHKVAPEALRETTAWLLSPPAWEDPQGDPGFSDLKLARIQFAAALSEAFRTESVDDKTALIRAAERLVGDQEANGSWDVDVPGVIGSPATYGDALGTYMARRTLDTASTSSFADAITRADDWFLSLTPTATVDVCAAALALSDRLGSLGSSRGEDDSPAGSKLRELVERILATQNSDGGWGAFPKSPSESFDTALALLALRATPEPRGGDRQPIEIAVVNGRSYLVNAQLPAGGWPETTRPSGFQSYAQHISTSGWATLALLKTRDSAKAQGSEAKGSQ